jgi:hypothetical protein
VTHAAEPYCLTWWASSTSQNEDDIPFKRGKSENGGGILRESELETASCVAGGTRRSAMESCLFWGHNSQVKGRHVRLI